jgi:NADH:ubiquinone oxidoreductase subunit F (NADH-binding)
LETRTPARGHDFYQKQFRIVLRNCGVIDPEKIDEYIARDGYAALEKVLFEMTPDQVVDELRSPACAGAAARDSPPGEVEVHEGRARPKDQKYVICNADEGDPGAYMDRSTLEGDPHSIFEAMIIAGLRDRREQGFIYIRAEYPLAIRAARDAIEQAREHGLLGENILGQRVRLRHRDPARRRRVRLRRGDRADRLDRGQARHADPRPPFPAVKGLWGKPTVINNVETWANIPVIISRAATGSRRSAREEGHEGLRPDRQDQQLRAHRGADGHHAARDHLRHRRRHPRRQEIQGRADRRPLRRRDPASYLDTPDRLRAPAGSSARSWARAA